MEGPPNDHSDSDSGESWTLLDNEVVLGEDINASKNIIKRFIAEKNSDKDEDTDGISIISDSEAETPSSFIVHSLLEDQSIKEEIPVYSPQNIDIETNLNNNVDEDTEPLVEGHITGDNIKHKIYVHRRNNRLSTVLNIIMLVSVMTATGVAIGHMWGAKNDCTTQTTPSFNKVLSDLYKLQAENANYRSKLRELSLIIEDNLHNECERESDASLNKNESVKCRQQKIHEIQKYLKTNVEAKRNKRSAIPHTQKQYLSKLKKDLNSQNISDTKVVDEKLDIKAVPKDHIVSENLQQHKNVDEMFPPELKERKISYADSLKSNNFVRQGVDEILYKYTEKKLKQHKKPKESINVPQSFISEEDIVKDNRYSTPKHKIGGKKHDHQKYRNMKRRNKHEIWELKEGLLKYYEDLPVNRLKVNFLNGEKNQGDKRYNKVPKRIEREPRKLNPYNVYMKKGEIESYIPDENFNWFDNRAQLRKEARKKQQLELMNVSNVNLAEWHFKRMQRREDYRAKQNSTYKKKGCKSKP